MPAISDPIAAAGSLFRSPAAEETAGINCLFIEHLAQQNLTYSMQVFMHESGMTNRVYGKEDILQMMGLSHSRSVYQRLIQHTRKDVPLVSGIVRLLAESHSWYAK